MEGELIQKYLDNCCSKKEFEEAIKLLSKSDASEKYDDHFEKIWYNNKANKPSQSIDSLRIEANQVLMFARRKEKHNIKPINKHIGIAASIVLITCCSLIFRNYIAKDNLKMIKQQTYYGETKKINLSDGSIVNLNAGSKLIYLENFSGDTRRLTLDGHAFFDVAPNPDKPFIIDIGELTITVLGTSFDIRSYSEDESAIITVAEGKVKVSNSKNNSSEEFLLKPNEQLVFTKSKMHFNKHVVDAHKFTSWRTGVLYFNKTPISDIVKQLERQYNVVIKVESPEILNLNVSGKHTNENLTNVLESLCFTHNLSFKLIDSSNIILSKK